MTETFADFIKAARDMARERAGKALAARGFVAAGDMWSGGIPLSDGTAVPVRLALPATFPDALPQVFLVERGLGHIAHVERTGKICVAPDNGTLIDADRPEDIVVDTLALAARVLQANGDPGQRQELASEFSAYWLEDSPLTLLSACPPDVATGPVSLVRLSADGSRALVAESAHAARDWLQATGKSDRGMENAFFIRLNTLPHPPAFGKRLILRQLFPLVSPDAAPGDVQMLWSWLQVHGPPAVLVFSAPIGVGKARVLFAAVIPGLPTDAAAASQRGFRPGRVPKPLLLKRAQSPSFDSRCLAWILATCCREEEVIWS